MLIENPLAGRQRFELRKDLRSFAVRPYVVFCVPFSGGIEIIHVMHGHQDIDADDMA